MDFLGPLPVTPNGNKYILVVNDYATRYVCAFPLKTADAPAVSQVLIERVFLEYGPPATILSDRGPHFHNALIEAITQLFMARHVFSSGYRPQTAGITERFNQTLLDLLAMYVDKNQRNWDQLVPYVVFAYRTLYNPTVKNVPFYLLHGYEPVLPHELPLLPPHANQSAADREWNMVAQRLNEARKMAKESVHRVHLATQQRVDAYHRSPPAYKPGDLVMAIKPYVAPRGTLKLSAHIYDGPYQVSRYMPGFRTVRLTRVSDGEPRLAHIDNLKPYHASDLRDPLPDVPEPQPTEQEQRKALETLERACHIAKHVIGQGRARAAVTGILGQSGLAPLPPQLQQALDQMARPSAPPDVIHEPPSHNSSAKRPRSPSPSPRVRTEPSVPPAQPSTSFRIVENASAPWKPVRNDLSTWYDSLPSGPSPPSSPTSRFGRQLRSRR